MKRSAKKMRRLVIQIPLALGILIMMPFALPFLVAPIFPAYWSSIWSAISQPDLKALYLGLLFPVGAYGILGLWASVVLPEAFLRRHDILRRIVIVTLVGGSLTAVTFLVSVVPSHFIARDYSRLLGDAWLYVGALVVACWNLRRYLKQKPNKSAQTTTGSSAPDRV